MATAVAKPIDVIDRMVLFNYDVIAKKLGDVNEPVGGFAKRIF
jgi:hypothetical protein